MANKDLGPVTAYAYYYANTTDNPKLTEAQFKAKLAGLPADILAAEEAVQTVTGLQAQATQLATTAAPTATYNHTTNKIEFGIPKGNGIASVTHTATSGSVKTYTITFDNGATTTFDVTDGELTEEYAEENLVYNQGYYDDVSVGGADQLISNIGIEDNAPYLFRTAGGSAEIGDKEEDMLVGGTVCWNQLALNGDFATDSVWYFSYATKTFSPGEVTAVSNQTDVVGSQVIQGSHSFMEGEKLLVCLRAKSSDIPSVRVRYPYTKNFSSWVADGSYHTVYAIGSADNLLSQLGIQFVKDNASDAGSMTIKSLACFSLTQMFGSTIADYIYSLETATPGAGVAWFKKLFPAPYYEYNAGQLMSVKAVGHKTTHFNQWDEEWEKGYIDSTGSPHPEGNGIYSKNYNRILPNTTYYGYYGSNTTIFFVEYDSNYNFISRQDAQNTSFTTSANAAYFKISTAYNAATTYNHDICINLSWDGSRDGEYEEYKEHLYPLDSDLELRGMLKLDEDDKLYYDGDTYESSGKVTRRYGIVDLGTLTWTIGSYGQMECAIDGFKPVSTNIVPNMITTAFQTIAYVDRNAVASPAMMYRADGGAVEVRNSGYNNATTFKTAMSGVYLVYELETTTTEEADQFTNPQTVDDFGTEEYIDTRDVQIPVGHVTKYQANLKAKLEMAPNSPDGDGDYFVRSSGGTNEYVKFKGEVAYQNGNYPDMHVGLADQLDSDIFEEDSVPYTFRTSGGSIEIGDREYDEIVGGTVCWNQFADVKGVGDSGLTLTLTNGIFAIDGTATNTYSSVLRNIDVVIDHKYIMYTKIISNPNNLSFRVGLLNANGNVYINDSIIFSSNYTKATGVGFDKISVNTDYSGIKFNLIIADLTQMFGSTIADYIYNLEQSTPGAGVAWFRKLFPAPYYEYNAGELKSVEGLVSHDMTGFNLFDKSKATLGKYMNEGGQESSNSSMAHSDYIRVIPNTTYYAKLTATSGYYGAILYDANKVRIKNKLPSLGNDTVVTNDDACYYVVLNFKKSEIDDVCFNLAWDNSRNGEYEPYEEHSYDLDDSLELRGIPKLDANNNLYYDGDIYESDGTVTRRYGIVDMGALEWTKGNRNNDDTGYLFYVRLLSAKARSKVLCTKYTESSYQSVWERMNVGTIQIDSSQYLIICSTEESAEAFKTAMSGVYLIYELAEPTTEEATPYQNPQIVDDFGTEEYVFDDSITIPIPVGHNTKYTANLKAKLEMAPNSPSGDGDYIVRQANGTNSYVPLVLPLDELPALPSENGNYVLKVTVNGSTKTMSWEAQES